MHGMEDDPVWEEDDEDLSNDDSVGSEYLSHWCVCIFLLPQH
jgi:hypothetical protein